MRTSSSAMFWPTCSELSGRLMINALLESVMQAEEIAQLAQRKAKQEIPELIAALSRNRLTDHHRFLLRHALRHLDFLELEIEALNTEIRSRLDTEQFREKQALLQSIPGIKEGGVRTRSSQRSRPRCGAEVPPRMLTLHPGLASARAITRVPESRKAGRTNPGNN